MSSDLKNINRGILEEFISQYREHPCLWNIKSKHYQDKVKREAAYDVLVNIYRQIDLNATKETVLKKINSLRTNYRREKKRVEHFLRSGIVTNEIYKPMLWYYPLFEFLDDQHALRNSVVNSSETKEEVDSPSEYVEHQVDEYDQTEPDIRLFESEEIAHNSTRKRGNPATISNQNKRCDSLPETIEHSFKKPKPKEDRYEIFGNTVALKMRDIQNNHQRLLVEKIINDALFMAEMGLLNMSHCIQESRSINVTSSYDPRYYENNMGNLPQSSIVYHDSSQVTVKSENSN